MLLRCTGHSSLRSLARGYVKPARKYIKCLVTEWVLVCRSNIHIKIFNPLCSTVLLEAAYIGKMKIETIIPNVLKQYMRRVIISFVGTLHYT